MGTKSFRLFLGVIILLFYSGLADYAYHRHRHHYQQLNANREHITLSGLFTHSHYPSIRFALEQVNSRSAIFQTNLQFHLDGQERIIHCDVGAGVKTFFDMFNETSSLSVLLTDACQTVLSYITETATYFHLPVISFTDSDLSLLAKDRYSYFYHIVPSDHAHNLVRKQLLQYFNWTRFGLIYQHGSKYTLVANDFSNLTAMDEQQFEVNLTRGLAYRHGAEWRDDNARYIRAILNDFKTRDVRIIIANFNETVARQIFCHVAREEVYGSRYQWIILGYPSLSAWWNEPTDCSMQELVRALNGTLQTRAPSVSVDEKENRSDHLSEYFGHFSGSDKNYFDAYAYDTIWSLAYLYQFHLSNNQSRSDLLRQAFENIDFLGATGRVRYFNGGRIGEVLVEQFVACRMMTDGTCTIPCYEKEEDCNLTVVRIFLAKHLESKEDLPFLYKLNPIMWHGNGPPRDRTNQTVQFEHIYLSVFISISICSAIGLIISCVFLAFNIHFRFHRYIRMSSPLLNNIILGGCMLAYISVILMGVNSSLFSKKPYVEMIMNIICPIRVWLLCISFTLAFGSMFSKTWRVHSIFTNINITKKGIHDSRLLAIVALLLFLDLIFLIFWQIFDAIHWELVYDVSHRLKHNQDIEIIPYREECKSQNMSLWFVILVIYKGLLIFYGSFLSWKTRHVKIPALNDSRYIGLSVYIVFICCALGSLVIFIPSEQIQFSYVLRSFFIVICTTSTVCLVFVPKIIEVHRDPYSRKKQPRVTGRFHEKDSRPTLFTVQHLNTAISDNNELKLVLSIQEQTLSRLLEQLKNSQIGKKNMNDVEPFELQRLVASDDEGDEEEEGEDDMSTVEDESSVHFPENHSQVQTGRLARTVSLCLFNKTQVGQLQTAETAGIARYSIPSHDDHYRASPSSSAARILLRQTYQNCTNDPSKKAPTKLLEIVESTETSSNDIDHSYDGLISLNETRLDEMIETDLVSSSTT